MADTLVTSARSVHRDGSGPINPRDMATITHGAVFAEQIYDEACVNMIGLFTDCTKRIDDFTELGFREQASCYCCHRSDGTLTWTDELGYYASDCVDWAITGEPDTAYSVAEGTPSLHDTSSVTRSTRSTQTTRTATTGARKSKGSRSPVKSASDLRLSERPAESLELNSFDQLPSDVAALFAQVKRVCVSRGRNTERKC